MKAAQVELTRLLAEVDNGTSIDPSRVTVAEYVRTWLDGATHLAPKPIERYRELAEHQIIPHLGGTMLQKLRPSQISDWHRALLRSGGRDSWPLSPRTVGHAHRVLHSALARAAKIEIVSRNVARVLSPPKVEAREAESLDDTQILGVLTGLEDHFLYPVVVTHSVRECAAASSAASNGAWWIWIMQRSPLSAAWNKPTQVCE